MENDIKPISSYKIPGRPLMGVTILLVEDSRYCAEAVRLLSMRSGARLRRADMVKSAMKHLAIYRPDLLIVDLGLPDGAGEDFIKSLHARESAPPPILAISGIVEEETRSRAIKAGANGFMPKPIANIAQFQKTVEALVFKTGGVSGFAPMTVGQKGLALDQQALLDDLSRIEQMLGSALPAQDRGRMQYCAQFISSVAQTAQDQEMMLGAKKFFTRIIAGNDGQKSGQDVLRIVQARLKKEASPFGESRVA